MKGILDAYSTMTFGPQHGLKFQLRRNAAKRDAKQAVIKVGRAGQHNGSLIVTLQGKHHYRTQKPTTAVLTVNPQGGGSYRLEFCEYFLRSCTFETDVSGNLYTELELEQRNHGTSV